MRDKLRKMHQEGPLRCSYIIEDNHSLRTLTNNVIKSDVIAQWICGDELKVDQLVFIYETVKLIYDSALKNHLVLEINPEEGEEKPKQVDIEINKKLISYVIPTLVAYKSTLNVTRIKWTKLREWEKIKERKEKDGIHTTVLKIQEEQLAALKEEEEKVFEIENEPKKPVKKN